MTAPAGKKVLVLSDSDGLSRAIEANLTNHLEAEIVRLISDPSVRQTCERREDKFDLIVVAMISPTNEPIVALARAALTDRIGQVPLLIVSDRPFKADPDDQISHLDFPFDVDRLHAQVEQALHITGTLDATTPQPDAECVDVT